LIEGILMRDTVAALYGPPASGKSLLANDLANCIASNCKLWRRRQVTSGTVLYVMAEGVAGLDQRVRAWQVDTRIYDSGMTDIRWLPRAVNLLEPVWSGALAAVAVELRPVLIVIDTLARSMAGGDENTGKDMGTLITAADGLRQSTGATVLLVHHTPKIGGSMRGHSSLEGAVDTAIEVTQNEGVVKIRCTKQKDAAKFEPIYLHIVPVPNTASVVLRDAPDERDELAMVHLVGRLRDWLDTHCSSEGVTTVQMERNVESVTEDDLLRAIKLMEDLGEIHRTGSRWFPIARTRGSTRLRLDEV
jgi:RecA-family ATPase